MSINPETSLEELAAIVSQALAQAGIDAVLSGGGTVAQYSENEYMSADLDFVTRLPARQPGQALRFLVTFPM